MKETKGIDTILPEQIRFYRQKKGLTQGQLSELVNVTEHYIAEVENAIKFPSIDLIKSISSALNVPLYNLMQSQDNISETNYLELQNILMSKDETELSTMLDVLLTINKI